mgnify:CR=1 FL=1
MDDYDAGFQKGAKHGFNMALFAVRNIDRQMSETSRFYHAEKDLLYKIYEEIKFEMTKEVGDTIKYTNKKEEYHVTEDGVIEKQ